MSDIKIDARQLKRLDKQLSQAGIDYKKGANDLLKKIGVVVKGQAMKNAPQKTGDLTRSITADVGKNQVSIGVPSNSAGGRYAEAMHDGKGKSWKERGKRTRQKGPQADDKYIERAAETTSKEIGNMIDDTVARLTGF